MSFKSFKFSLAVFVVDRNSPHRTHIKLDTQELEKAAQVREEEQHVNTKWEWTNDAGAGPRNEAKRGANPSSWNDLDLRTRNMARG